MRPTNCPTDEENGHIIFSEGQELGPGARAIGTYPSPFAPFHTEFNRRKNTAALRKLLTEKIESLLEPRFITSPEVSELIESIITSTDSRNILEIGTYSGFTTLHMLRAIVGKQGAKVTSIDARPCHDTEFFSKPGIAEHFRHITGYTPGILSQLQGEKFDLVFIDSDHSVEHSQKEKEALMSLTDRGSVWLFHDVPEWQTPDNRRQPPIRDWLDQLVHERFFFGCCLPSCEQLDCLYNYGEGYPKQCNPGLGIYIRR